MESSDGSGGRSAPGAGRAAFVSPETRVLELPGEHALELGGRLPGLRIAYRTWGTLAPDGANAVVVCHALTGSADADLWWTRLFGPGRSLDPERDFVVCSNILGSCYGTTGPAEIDPTTGKPWHGTFPAITIRDMIRVQRRLVDALGDLRRPALARRAVRRRRSARRRPLRRADDGDALVPEPAVVRDAVRAARADRGPVRDRELPPLPGPAARRPLRPRDLRRAHPGDGHARRVARPRRLRAGAPLASAADARRVDRLGRPLLALGAAGGGDARARRAARGDGLAARPRRLPHRRRPPRRHDLRLPRARASRARTRRAGGGGDLHGRRGGDRPRLRGAGRLSPRPREGEGRLGAARADRRAEDRARARLRHR